MPYSSRNHLKKLRLAMVCASVEPSPVLLIQEKYWERDGVFSSAPGKTFDWGKPYVIVLQINVIQNNIFFIIGSKRFIDHPHGSRE
jgi:hypothetical protein